MTDNKEQPSSKDPLTADVYKISLNDEPHSDRHREEDRKSNSQNSLDEILTNILDQIPADEVEKISTEIDITLNARPIGNVERRPTGDQYNPVRRPSRAGSELAKSMKDIAAKALLELGNMDSDDEDEIDM